MIKPIVEHSTDIQVLLQMYHQGKTSTSSTVYYSYCYSSQTGEIVTICSLNEDERQSQMRLWTINGQLVNAINTETAILDSCWTNAEEGRNCNAIITAHVDGSIQEHGRNLV